MMDAQTVAIFGVILGSPPLGLVAARYLRPKATVPERVASLETSLDRLSERLEKSENDFRVLQDYTHRLRQHISDQKPPPPPPWPEELTS